MVRPQPPSLESHDCETLQGSSAAASPFAAVRADGLSSGRPAQSWRHVVGAAIGATALFLVLLLAVALFGDASTHGGIYPSATQGKIYRAH